MIDKKALKSILSYIEEQRFVASFIVAFIIIWFAWHNQLFGAFLHAEGDFLIRLSAGFSAVEKNQYIVVFFLTCFFTMLRLAFQYFRYRSEAFLNASDDIMEGMGADQKFAKDSDIANLMEALTKTKEQLADAIARENKAIADKNDVIKKLLSVQNELEEAKADIDVLKKTQE